MLGDPDHKKPSTSGAEVVGVAKAPQAKAKTKVKTHRKTAAERTAAKIKQRKTRKDCRTPEAGEVFGKLRVLQRVRDDLHTKSPNLRRRVRVRCECGRDITIPVYYLYRQPNPKRECGQCGEKSLIMQHNSEFRCWLMMHQRCENPNHVSYKHYAERGIRIHPSFHRSLPDHAGFIAWLNEIGPRPSKLFSVDRIDNTKGYEPGNLRWATAKQQRANQGNRKSGELIDSDE